MVQEDKDSRTSTAFSSVVDVNFSKRNFGSVARSQVKGQDRDRDFFLMLE